MEQTVSIIAGVVFIVVIGAVLVAESWLRRGVR